MSKILEVMPKPNRFTFEIEISSCTTNGDVIKALFPNREIIIDDRNKTYIGYVIDADDEWPVWFKRDWWDAPYRRE